MSEQICKNCQHYVQHYGLGEEHFYRIYDGHCTEKRPRNKRPDTKACENFVYGSSDDARFVNKKYLSKALLEYMCRLELLPELAERDSTAGEVLREKDRRKL